MKKTIGIVETKYGKLRGGASDRPEYEGITCFKGVPYAAPPVGELRWKPPVDPESWEGVRDCDSYAPMAYQIMGSGIGFEPWGTDFYYMGHPQASEDCLYLNIVTGAENPGEKRPVYMWFHGGGLNTGYSYEVEFDGSELARRGIVVVTVGQRLNVFGYLCCRQLSEEQGGTSGNYGLMDEVKALDWVYENIAAFGGDPENITIGGQSGGTSKTGALACSPHQKGRVKRVINQSSLNWNSVYDSVQEAEEAAVRYFKAIGLDPDMPLSALREVEPAAFHRPIPPADRADRMAPRMPGSMVFDGDYVPNKEQIVSYRQYASAVDVLSGVNNGEGRMAAGMYLGGGEEMSAENYYAMAKALLGEELYEKYDFESLCPATDETANRVSRYLAARGLTGGFMSGFKSRYFGAYRKAEGQTGRTYAYLFSRIPPTREEDEQPGTRRQKEYLLAWHSAELWYTFASLRKGVPPARPWEELDFELAQKMCDYWANFMKSGDPNGEGLPFWPQADESMAWIDFGDEITVHPGKDRLDALVEEYNRSNGLLP